MSKFNIGDFVRKASERYAQHRQYKTGVTWREVLQKKGENRLRRAKSSYLQKGLETMRQIILNDQETEEEKNAFKIAKERKQRYEKKGSMLQALLKALERTKPTATRYTVITVTFSDNKKTGFTVTPFNKDKIKKILEKITSDTFVAGNVSDAFVGMIQGKKIRDFSIDYRDPTKTKNLFTKRKREGAFFPYSHNIDNDHVEKVLQELQIYKKGFVPTNPDICFIQAIRGQSIPDSIINKIKHDVRSEFISTRDIKKVCEINGIYIELRLEKNQMETEKYGNPSSEYRAKICKQGKHYFRYIKNTGITSFFIKNYEQMKHKKDGHLFYKKDERTSKRFIDSYNLVQHLIKNKNLLEDVDYDIIKSFVNVTVDDEKIYNWDIDACCKPIEVKNKESQDRYVNIYFDSETYCSKTNKHIPYLCSYLDDENDGKSFHGYACIQEMLDYLANMYGTSKFKEAPTLRMFAHNSTYDGSFLIKYLQGLQILEKDNKYVSMKGFYCFNKGPKKFIQIAVRDSYRIIPMSISDIPKSLGFGDEVAKEVMYYDMYNYKTIDHITKVTKKELKKYINIYNENSQIESEKLEEKKKTFYDNLKTWNCINEDGTYDLQMYSQKYCEIDCKVLKRGLQEFQRVFREIDNRIDVYEFFSLPSLAEYYFKINGCFDGCYQLAGSIGTWFSNFVHGGRVMTRDNKMLKVEKEIQDFDAVSLYPSAMKLFNGYLKGMPKKLTRFDYETVKKYDGYFVKVKVNKVGIPRPFPLLCYKEDGSKCWSNDMEGRYVFLDKYGLEDAIEFQDIDFDIVEGFYFDEGFNTKIKDQIQVIFSKRLEAKKAGNDALQLVYKLLMNSSYGKLIQKTPDSEIKYILTKDLEKFIDSHYNHIKIWQTIQETEYTRVEMFKSLDTSFSAPHLGCSVLSYSKRIMNQVICLADDYNINIYYQDTDSMHIDADKVNQLAVLFQEKYGRELIGKSMGQFHCDFDFKGCSDVKSVGLIALGKKMYIDKLVGVKDSKLQMGFHTRLKGISEGAITDYCDRKKIDRWELFNRLYSGKGITFNLMVNNKVQFKKNKYQEYETNDGSFTRKIKLA